MSILRVEEAYRLELEYISETHLSDAEERDKVRLSPVLGEFRVEGVIAPAK